MNKKCVGCGAFLQAGNPDEIGYIKEMDIIAILGSMLDNAMEECVKENDTDILKIELKCSKHKEMLLIKMINSTCKIK